MAQVWDRIKCLWAGKEVMTKKCAPGQSEMMEIIKITIDDVLEGLAADLAIYISSTTTKRNGSSSRFDILQLIDPQIEASIVIQI